MAWQESLVEGLRSPRTVTVVHAGSFHFKSSIEFGVVYAELSAEFGSDNFKFWFVDIFEKPELAKKLKIKSIAYPLISYC